MGKQKPITGHIDGNFVIFDLDNISREFYNQKRFGEIKETHFQLSLLEAAYLLEKGRIEIKSGTGRKLTFGGFIKKASKTEPEFMTKYLVFKDMRNKGYVVKTALKFGADMRVYEKGIKPGEDHAKWVLYAVSERDKLTWFEFSSKNRVAHSTRKNLLIAIVDGEGDITYYEIRWIKT